MDSVPEHMAVDESTSLQTTWPDQDVTSTNSGSHINSVPLNDPSQWSADRVQQWLVSHGFSRDWQETFKTLGLEGSIFLEIGRGHGGKGNVAMMHQIVFPQLAKQCTASGTGWDQAKERDEGRKLRRLLRQIVEPGNDHYYSYTQQRIGFSPMSNFSSPATFMTAESPASFMTARSAYNSPVGGLAVSTIIDEPASLRLPNALAKLSIDYQAELRDKELLQPFDMELNWSGKGQHVTFAPSEKVPLEVLSHLGASQTALVERVLCRRVALARKTMRCTHNWTIADALREVYHLQNFRHFHIVQLVGTYLQGRKFSILMYPAADCHLGTFLEDTADMNDTSEREAERWHRRMFLGSTFACLASAVAFVHDNTTKHMDIKPQNMLVRRTRDPPLNRPFHLCWRIYLADFGLSRSFASNDNSQTDGPTPNTPKYCAPEVYEYDFRGRAADIFSLGCVYAEIVTTYASRHPYEFADFRRNSEGNGAYRTNLPRVTQWLDELSPYWPIIHPLKSLIRVMLRPDPRERPKAAIIARILHYVAPVRFNHCGMDPEPYIAHSESTSSYPRFLGSSDPPAHPPGYGVPGTQWAESWSRAILSNLTEDEQELLKLEPIHFSAATAKACYYQPRKTAASWGYVPSLLEIPFDKFETNRCH
jgi:serine/threonine protein kinase